MKVTSFYIGRQEWAIITVDKNTIKELYDKEYGEASDYVFGLTLYPSHEIWINNDMCFDQQLNTLAHELTHCFIWCNGLYHTDEFNEEMICDIVSASYNFVYEIVALFERSIRLQDDIIS